MEAALGDSSETLTNIKDLIYNQTYLPVSPEDMTQLSGDTIFKAISSTSLFPIHYANHDTLPKSNENPPKTQRKFAQSLMEWSLPTERRQKPETSPSNTPQPGNEAAMALLSPDQSGKYFVPRTISLDPDAEITVGRGNGLKAKPCMSNAIFECKVLSRLHATLSYHRRHFYLKDRHSSNGTFVNKTRISADDEFEIYSSDVIQFGQDVLDPTTNEKHRCIVAKIELIHPSGKKCKTRPQLEEQIVPVHSEEEIYMLREAVEEALEHEDELGDKMDTIQALLKNIKEEVSQNWTAMINEDELLTKIERLESDQYENKIGSDNYNERSEYEDNVKRLLKSSSDQKLLAQNSFIQAQKMAKDKLRENQKLKQQIKELKGGETKETSNETETDTEKMHLENGEDFDSKSAAAVFIVNGQEMNFEGEKETQGGGSRGRKTNLKLNIGKEKGKDTKNEQHKDNQTENATCIKTDDLNTGTKRENSSKEESQHEKAKDEIRSDLQKNNQQEIQGGKLQIKSYKFSSNVTSDTAERHVEFQPENENNEISKESEPDDDLTPPAGESEEPVEEVEICYDDQPFISELYALHPIIEEEELSSSDESKNVMHMDIKLNRMTTNKKRENENERSSQKSESETHKGTSSNEPNNDDKLNKSKNSSDKRMSNEASSENVKSIDATSATPKIANENGVGYKHAKLDKNALLNSDVIQIGSNDSKRQISKKGNRSPNPEFISSTKINGISINGKDILEVEDDCTDSRSVKLPLKHVDEDEQVKSSTERKLLEKSVNALEKMVKRVDDKFDKIEKLISTIDDHDRMLRETKRRFDTLDKCNSVLIRVQTATHHSIIYISGFLIGLIAILLVKLSARENRRLETW